MSRLRGDNLLTRPRIERQKAERLRKQLKKQLDEATDPEEVAKARANFHIADVDLHYTRYFPFLERYESLYSAKLAKEDPEGGQTIAMRALHSARPPMWKVVEEALEKGQAALDALQERRSRVSRSEGAPGEKALGQSSGVKSKKGSGAVQSKLDRSRGQGRHVKMEREMEDKKLPDDDAGADSDGSGFFG